MTTFLLLLSLILNAAAIFAIILLYLRQNRLVEAEKKQEKIISEMEEIFSSYLYELKEENDKFLELMTNTNIQVNTGKEEMHPDETNMGSQKDPEVRNHKIQQHRPGKGISYHAARQAYHKAGESITVPPGDTELTEIDNGQPADPEPKTKEISLIDQVTAMRHQGLTIEEIARDLDKGKTEIELLLKFRQNTKD
ncbi:hypothetical protein J7E38_20660 [Bacillus sp. ISL-35]|uniref:hypothetical protein n=1 Tax=Bacillus sp. ISL-35 TaxID=2819122 RepID=UPI001BEBABF5|nr:hypothetical protein [Bacillus sp. ISL-35]MBT2681381.1 hypothetical protein [Bacillus sp. ISL-35]MBT2701848.1 hypothetical protein [Chryseobacterium sp. ISL-80]